MPIPPSALVSHSDRQTRHIGERLGALCAPGDLILLEGGLGTGKTTLTQGIARGLGIAGPVNSPTFTLIKEYTGRVPLYHLDLYRLDALEDVADLGIEEYLEGDGVCVVEWPERAAPLWPADHLLIRLTATGPHARRLDLASRGPRGAVLRDDLARALHAAAPGPHEEAV
jgi:tRNA threonylcarbamoyladenosine biosynthesis protein TsaE